jgi:predicted nucleic acid-binding protein
MAYPVRLFAASASGNVASSKSRGIDRSIEMVIDLGQHLFDTLYHAVALETPDAVLITADERYFRAARHAGRIARLRDWTGDARA